MSFLLDDDSEDSFQSPYQTRQNEKQSPNADDQEIETLQKQIDDMNNFLLSVQSHAGDRQQRYEKMIEKIKLAISDENKKCSFLLDQQVEEQENEIKNLLFTQNSEIEEIIEGARKVDIDTSNWNVIKNDLGELGNQIEVIDMRTKINRVQAEGRELEFTKSKIAEENCLKQKEAIKNQERQILSLQQEIERYQMAQRQENIKYNNVIDECTQAMERHEKTHSISINKMNYEISQREEIFGGHLKVVQRQMEKEKQRSDVDSKALKDTEDSLVQLKKKTQQNCVQQLSNSTKDIERIQNILRKNAETEESRMQGTTSSISKTQNLQRQNQLMKQKIEQVSAEIEKIQSHIEVGCSELKKAQTPKKGQLSNNFNNQYRLSFH